MKNSFSEITARLWKESDFLSQRITQEIDKLPSLKGIEYALDLNHINYLQGQRDGIQKALDMIRIFRK